MSTENNTLLALNPIPTVFLQPSAYTSPFPNGIGRNCWAKLNLRILDRCGDGVAFVWVPIAT